MLVSSRARHGRLNGIMYTDFVAMYGLRGCSAPSRLLILVLYKSFAYFLPYLLFLPYLFTSLRICRFHFHAGGHKKRPNLV